MSTADVDFPQVSSLQDAALVARLAHEIWYEHYVPIIGREQVDYMVPRFQSEAAILGQIAKGLQYFLILRGGDACGYLAIEPQPDERKMFLSKLYVLKSARHHGLGRQALDFIEAQARAGGGGWTPCGSPSTNSIPPCTRTSASVS
ncbi:MAG: GNAT family N-acetyltransferase [Steroidobacteraceae bacterium]